MFLVLAALRFQNAPSIGVEVELHHWDLPGNRAAHPSLTAFYRLLVATNIDVSVADGYVVLSGIVDTPAAKQAAERATRYTIGVIDVENRLQVRSGAPSPP